MTILKNHRSREQVNVSQRSNLAEPEKRYIFNHSHPSNLTTSPSRTQTKRAHRASTFNIIVVLFSYGITIVLYVGNIIYVNRLALEVSQLQSRYEKIANTNTILQADVDRKSARERIGKLASKMLGLKYPKAHPTQFEIDEVKLGKALTN